MPFEIMDQSNASASSHFLKTFVSQLRDKLDFGSQIPCLITKAYIEAAEVMLDDDVASNKAIGSYGAIFLQHQQKNSKRFSVLTHCNTGSLATTGYGTTLGAIRALHVEGVLEKALYRNTTLQSGIQTTAFELVHEKIPATLIADSVAAALMKEGRVSAVFVGADRVAANGDTTNKIGTYSLALCAMYHHRQASSGATNSISIQSPSTEDLN